MARYVTRNPDGKIVSTFATEQFPEQEILEDDHADIVAFNSPRLPLVAKRAALIRTLAAHNLLEPIRAYVAQADAIVQELWLSPEFHRDDPILIACATEFGILDQLDGLFQEAAGDQITITPL